MPDLTFVLPHWLYWSSLAVFPALAMALVARQRRAGPRPAVSLALGYMLLITAGFAGIHRYYVKSWQGVVYLPLLLAIILANVETRDAREAISSAESQVMIAEFDVEQAEQQVEAGAEGAAAALDETRAGLAQAKAAFGAAQDEFEHWQTMSLYVAIAIALLLVFDAVRLPALVRRCNAREPAVGPPEAEAEEAVPPAAERAPAAIRLFESVSRWSGEYVAYWSVIAVFTYYYEVVARYLFNSPTNWVHESMFLMFGMQYLLSGAYAFLNDSHVRVDIFYARLSRRGRALTDLLTSLFFFIFAGTLLVTGWTFLMDSVGVWEVSFTEWAIQYWPVKIAIVVGAALILLQGLAKVLRDFAILVGREA
jgi:TRAP-type mannitol/chloroaromatic compound transport system permease small subunit